MKNIALSMIACLVSTMVFAQTIVETKPSPDYFTLSNPVIVVDKSEEQLLHFTAELLQQDIKAVTGLTATISATIPQKAGTLIVLGTVGKSTILNELQSKKIIKQSAINNQWEAFHLQTVNAPMPGISNAMIITGADRRGTSFGVFEFS